MENPEAKSDANKCEAAGTPVGQKTMQRQKMMKST